MTSIEALALALIQRARIASPAQAIRDADTAGFTPILLANAALEHARAFMPAGYPRIDFIEGPDAAARQYADASLIFLRHDARQDRNARLEALCDRARVHVAPNFEKLREAFKARLARRNARITETGRAFSPSGADYCLYKAREDVLFGREPAHALPDMLTHGSVVRTRKADGSRATFVVAHVPDSDTGWAQDDWTCIGVCLVEMPREGYVSPQDVADEVAAGSGFYNVRASLWGIESDSGATFLDDVARDLVFEARSANARFHP